MDSQVHVHACRGPGGNYVGILGSGEPSARASHCQSMSKLSGVEPTVCAASSNIANVCYSNPCRSFLQNLREFAELCSQLNATPIYTELLLRLLEAVLSSTSTDLYWWITYCHWICLCRPICAINPTGHWVAAESNAYCTGCWTFCYIQGCAACHHGCVSTE